MPAYEQAVGIVRAGGVISRVGVPQYEDAPIGFASLFGRNIRLAGGPAPARAYIEELMPDILDGTINPGKVFDATTGPRRRPRRLPGHGRSEEPQGPRHTVNQPPDPKSDDTSHLCHSQISDSALIGKSRTLRPVAWNTALAIAGATPVITISPHGAVHHHGVRDAVDSVVGSVRRRAGHLQSSIDSGLWGPDDHLWLRHRRLATVAIWRSTVRTSSSTLKQLWLCGFVPSDARAAAVAHNSGAGGCVLSTTCSTAGSRHGAVPTPPVATRALRTVPPTTSSATAAEHDANSYDWRSRTFR